MNTENIHLSHHTIHQSRPLDQSNSSYTKTQHHSILSTFSLSTQNSFLLETSFHSTSIFRYHLHSTSGRLLLFPTYNLTIHLTCLAAVKVEEAEDKSPPPLELPLPSSPNDHSNDSESQKSEKTEHTKNYTPDPELNKFIDEMIQKQQEEEQKMASKPTTTSTSPTWPTKNPRPKVTPNFKLKSKLKTTPTSKKLILTTYILQFLKQPASTTHV